MSASTAKKKRTPRSKRRPRGFFQAEGMTDLVIPMAVEDRLALRYLMMRTGQPTPQKTVMALIKSMILALQLEDDLKAKAANDASEATGDTETYTNTAGDTVKPDEFAAAQRDDLDAVLVGDAADLAGSGTPSVDQA